jgi:hypothetical protein
VQARDVSAVCLPSRGRSELKLQGYTESLHKRAVEMDVDGMNLRKILRHLKVHQRPAALWVINYAGAVLDLLVPDKVKELDKEELFFIGDKKTAPQYSDNCRL